MTTPKPPVVVEANGAQLLPPTGDERATVTSWFAHTLCDADFRSHNPVARSIAARLIVQVPA